MKKAFAKTTLGLASAAFFAAIGTQAVSADAYVVQQGDSFFGIASARGMDPYELAAKNGKSIFDTINPGDILEVDGAAQTYDPYNSTVYNAVSNADAVSDTEDVVLNTPTDFGNSYPIGQCTWGVKEMAPWASNWWGNANTWAVNASSQGYATGSVPTVGSIAVWDGGDYGHVAYVTDVQSDGTIQVLEANYNRQKQINNYRGYFNPDEFLGNVTYIYPN
ncbi:COG3942 and LysM peptidoglycan-binding domain-containing protein [Streptococcus panodentis]|uniref:Hydrolase n=1 Tax=Streptococcus panodentis TaxID=1581472 RepID=A0ABS5AVQ8_9STRE|nr:CHAP domain-containing protein [Streptococcus panodentis]MBP2620648.1 hydrolase [Streptococcus panodentis]